MILIVFSNTRQVFDALYPSFLEDLRIANARTFQDSGRGISASRNDDELVRFDCTWRGISNIQELGIGHMRWIGLVLYPDCLLVFEKYFQDLLLSQYVQIRVVVALEFRMQITMSCILPPAIRSDVLVVSFHGVIGVEILQILDFRVAEGSC